MRGKRRGGERPEERERERDHSSLPRSFLFIFSPGLNRRSKSYDVAQSAARGRG